MDKLVKLAFDALRYYLDTGKILNDYDKDLEDNHNGVIIEIKKEDTRERAGSIYPTRSNIALDIINESINLGIFNNALALRKEDLDHIYIQVLEIRKVRPIAKLEDFGVYDGLYLNYANNPVIVYRNDYESDYQMFEDAKDRANLDDFDVYNLEKFKILRHI
ncbi:MAG: hypothetical protein Q4D88_05345 [Anaerococcus sp.]|nr:hypothetical protein [Anaerococcus sp.]